jgi:hypothetical protein
MHLIAYTFWLIALGLALALVVTWLPLPVHPGGGW